MNVFCSPWPSDNAAGGEMAALAVSAFLHLHQLPACLEHFGWQASLPLHSLGDAYLPPPLSDNTASKHLFEEGISRGVQVGLSAKVF